MMSANIAVVITTVKELKDAERIAGELVVQRLAACVQIDGPIRSVYQWDGRQCSDQEYRLMIKTSVDQWDALEAKIDEIHPYDEPELIRIPIDACSAGYGRWVLESLSQG